jgi:hypothetical protein
MFFPERNMSFERRSLSSSLYSFFGKLIIKWRGWSICDDVGGAGFESRPLYRISRLKHFWIFWSLHANAWTIRNIRSQQLPPRSLPIHQSSYTLRVYRTNSECMVKWPVGQTMPMRCYR